MIRYLSGGPMSRNKRAHRCRECHAPATHAEVEERPAASLKRDGTIQRFTEPVSVYWCDQHSGMKALL